jgi:hypothetical protein
MTTAIFANGKLSSAPSRSADVDVKAAIAAALGSAPSQLSQAKSSDSRSLKCFGRTKTTDFFAKIFVADPFPVYVAVPWQEVLLSNGGYRPAEEQVDLEWSRSAQLRRVLPTDSVPRPLGRSREFRTIVWERVSGDSVVKAVLHKGWMPGTTRQLEAAMYQSGVWLRTLHKTTYAGTELFSAGELLNAILHKVKAEPASDYTRQAIQILAAQIDHLKSVRMLAACAVCHGDFTLANLIWNRQAQRLCVMDYENSVQQSVWHDLATVLFSLRKQLLNPLVPEALIRSMESAFWAGYGVISSDLLGFISALVGSRILYYYPSRVLSRGERHGWFGSITGTLYRSALEQKMTGRCLNALPANLPSN